MISISKNKWTWGLIISIFPAISSAFILIDPDYRLANPSNTTVYIADQTCPAVGVSNETMRVAIEVSIEQFWNTVAESKLRFRLGSVISKTTAAQVSPGEILIGCSSTAPGNGGVTNPNNTNGTALITLDSQIAAAGFDRLVGVIVHEMGHAAGLAHSGDAASVMTYETHGWGLKPNTLSQDDKDGIVYLYPIDGQAGGLVPGCSVKANHEIKNEKNVIIAICQEILGFLFLIFLFKALSSLWKRVF
jgi:hypothetical protein